MGSVTPFAANEAADDKPSWPRPDVACRPFRRRSP